MGLDQALKKLTTGIYVVTSKRGKTINGMIASWISQVSFSPPLIMVAIKQGRYSHSMIEDGQVFAVNILGKQHKRLVAIFKRQDRETKTLMNIPHDAKQTGAPVMNDALAYLDCKLVSKVTAGDHTLFIGEVVEGDLVKAGIPLSSHDMESTYGGVGPG